MLSSSTMRERRLEFLRDHDWVRRALMFEPRGHDMMSGSILYPPADPANDVGVLFIETSGCLPMCGHGTIGTVTIALEEGLVVPREPGRLRVETPAGLVTVEYVQEREKVRSVRLTNVPSFVFAKGVEVDCPGLGVLRVDIAFGGNFYAIIDPQANYPGLDGCTALDIIRWSRAVRERLNSALVFEHPIDSSIRGLGHVMWTGEPERPDSDARNAVFYGEKAIDRSPCGTGTSARMAQWAAAGRLKPGDTFVHESIIGSQFTGRVEERTTCGPYEAIVPSIEGWARITGHSQIVVDDEDDPFAHGFTVL
jgi:4-hydroxyproline epimerase